MARSPYLGPNVNASLIREVRMVFQQIFRHRENLNFWGDRSRKSKTDSWKCAACLRVHNRNPRAVVNDAETMTNGQYVCAKHLT